MEKALKYNEIRPNLKAYLEEVKANRQPIVFLLDRVQNKRNIAALFRLADAARISEILLYQCGTTPREDYKVKKVARSTPEYVPQRHLKERSEIAALKASYHLVALEITNQSVPYYEYSGPSPLVLVIGNEQRGISQEILDLCEESIHVPMLGRNSSMNVAMATGIATYGLLKEMGKLT